VKLLFLVDDLDGTSLAEPVLWLGDVMERWLSRGHRVDVICRRALEAGEEHDDPQGMRVMRPSERDFEVVLRPWTSCRCCSTSTTSGRCAPTTTCCAARR
jgi:hypothetical protein